MGYGNRKPYIEEMKIKHKDEYKKNGNQLPKIRQWKDLPKQAKKKTKKKSA